jgi:bifunctional UDP-N-acetylglucosamine pyrophosphorylase/glucosamine-1-phosphate N-acetyltransferase
MIQHVLGAAAAICSRPTIIVGYKGETVRKACGAEFRYVVQEEQMGTGHAVLSAKASLASLRFRTIVVIPSDHPLRTSDTLEALVTAHEAAGADLSFATVRVPHFSGRFSSFAHSGRIRRDSRGNILEIVEAKDADESQKNIAEVNVSYYCFRAGWLWAHIGALQSNNAAEELYLTDLVQLAVRENTTVRSVPLGNPFEGMGVNTAEQASAVETYLSAPHAFCA